MTAPVICWLRRDLRLNDNAALAAAADSGRPVIPVFITEPDLPWYHGGASALWLSQALAVFNDTLSTLGSRLVVRAGPAGPALDTLIEETGADTVYWNRRYEPHNVAHDSTLKAALGRRVTVRSFRGNVLFEPGSVMTAAEQPYRVFTPFYKACLKLGVSSPPTPAPTRLAAPERWPSSASNSDLGLTCGARWEADLAGHCNAGETHALRRLEHFAEAHAIDYPQQRDFPAAAAVSGLSPHFAHGELSVRDTWRVIAGSPRRSGTAWQTGGDAWLRQLVWREFSLHLLFHYPHTSEAPLNERFANFPWLDNTAHYEAWCRGRTGYPIVDAGMRELWATGTMHNRVRMVTASFLCKHLGLHWRLGAAWFWDTLFDADLANNSMGWQWVAGSGADAAPYFRIFNPITQGEKFDPDGLYIRRWVPELGEVDNVHAAGAGGYLAPLVEHRQAREDALARYAVVRG